MCVFLIMCMFIFIMMNVADMLSLPTLCSGVHYGELLYCLLSCFFALWERILPGTSRPSISFRNLKGVMIVTWKTLEPLCLLPLLAPNTVPGTRASPDNCLPFLSPSVLLQAWGYN